MGVGLTLRRVVRSAAWAVGCMLVGLALAVPAAAQIADSCVMPPMRNDQRPDPAGVPTEVRLGALVADVMGIDDVAQTVDIDIFYRLQWKDPRLVEIAGCRVHRTEIWTPLLELFNSNDLRTHRAFAADQVEIGEGGHVTYLQRFSGTVATYHELRHFPFDRHTFVLNLADLLSDADSLRIVPDHEFTTLAERLNIPDWTIESVTIDAADLLVGEVGRTLSVATIEISAARHAVYFIGKVLIPLALIVMMSWAVFWVDPIKHGPQIGLAATSMLTLIAFQFATASILPRLSYFTILDRLILGSTLLVFLALVEVTATSALVVHGRGELAQKVDRVARWLFPIAFLIWWAIVFTTGPFVG